jgi:hypothetical protein
MKGEQPLDGLLAFELDARGSNAREYFDLNAPVGEELNLPPRAGDHDLDGYGIVAKMPERVMQPLCIQTIQKSQKALKRVQVGSGHSGSRGCHLTPKLSCKGAQ